MKIKGGKYSDLQSAVVNRQSPVGELQAEGR